MWDTFQTLWNLTAFPALTWQMLVMWGVSFTLLYLAIVRGFEPLLLVPIAFGAFLANLPSNIAMPPPSLAVAPIDGTVVEAMVHIGERVERGHPLMTLRATSGEMVTVTAAGEGPVVSVAVEPGTSVFRGQPIVHIDNPEAGGLYYYIYQGIHLEIFPPLIFLGVGALTDFGPLIANPRTLLLGAAAQLGVFLTFLGAWGLFGFRPDEAASIGIIGGADGPTAIYLSSKLSPHLLSPIAVAAYSYMALVPLIQPPIMHALTTPAERKIRMKSLRPVSPFERLAFCLMVTAFCILMVPAVAPLIGMLMLGNLLRECRVTERLLKASQNEIINVITIFLGTSVGITMTADIFLRPQTLMIIALGVVAFGASTAGGVIMGKIMNWCTPHNPVNPLIGAAGVSAVPMAARVAHVEGLKADPNNYLLMHAMGPNVAGVIGTAVAAGYFLAVLGR